MRLGTRILARKQLELVALILALGALGCTHQMEILNLHQYQMTAKAPRSLKLSVQAPTGDEAAHALVWAVKDGLAAHSSVERVTMMSETPSDFRPDYLVSVRPASQFDGSGWNYLITFPGFLIFTHAWNGYVYRARTTTEVEIRRPDAPETIASRSLETSWNLRHCDFGRGAWTSSGWYTPFYGGINLIIGFFMIQYDDDATVPFVQAVHDPYGQFVANNVVDLISGVEARAEPPAPTAPSDSPAPTGQDAIPSPPPPVPTSSPPH